MKQQTSRQFFYLVVINYDENTYPQKVFLQEHEAISWGRREATKSAKNGNSMYEYVLFKQEISRTATLMRVKTLTPYKEQSAKVSTPSVEAFNWEEFKQHKGSDYDIDKYRFRGSDYDINLKRV